MNHEGDIIKLRPIGTVSSEVREPARRDWGDVSSEIIIDPAYLEALDGLDEFSHILVIFCFHRSALGSSVHLKTHPQARPDLPLVGIFATRSPVRPNPIGITIVRLIQRQGNTLVVQGLDAIDGTPVLDIKPYLPGDSVNWTKMPEWVHKLHVQGREETS